MASNLITKAEYKAYAGISSTNFDSEIDSLIPKVSAYVKNYCRRTFNDYFDDPKVERFSGGVAGFILSETPVVEVQSVEVSLDYGKTFTKLTQYAEWYQDSYFVMATNPAGWTRYPNGYKVTYTCGFEALPEDLKLAVMDLISFYRQNDGAIHSPKAPGTNSVQIDYATNVGLPAHIRRILDLYKEEV